MIYPPLISKRYDANGNLVYDEDRGISVIHYNVLNLPDTVQFINGNQIVNLYDAVGRKYRSITYIVPETAVIPRYEIMQYGFDIDTVEYMITEYAGTIENHYSRTDTTRRIHNATGYYTNNAYYHYIKDHLGNVCAVVHSTADTLIQGTIYYASGVPMAYSFGRDKQPYLYNGKEFVEAHGYNTYDYGFRGYYATIGRFTTIDPLAEQTPWQSPYAYAGNHFVNAIDWMGLSGMYGFNNSSRSCIILGPDYEFLGGADDGDNWIYIDEDGEWDPEDGHEGQKKWMPMGCSFKEYMQYFIFGGVSGGGLSETSIAQSDATYTQMTIRISIHVMAHEDYVESLQKKNDPGRLPSDIERYMKNIPEQDRLLITNPVIQGTAIAIAAPFITVEAMWIFYTAEGNILAQFIAGFAEGWSKGQMGAGPDLPYLNESPVYQAGSNLGSLFYEIFH